MIEDIKTCIETAGVPLNFGTFEIYGIPGFALSVLHKGEVTLYEIEKQWFAFQVATADIVDNSILEDSLFTLDDGSYLYTFLVSGTPNPDLTGFSKLHAEYVGKVLS